MKRLTGIVLALMILFGLSFAQAAGITDYTIEEKLIRQIRSSGLRGEIRLEATGKEAPFFLDDSGWAAVRAFSDRFALSFESTVRMEAFSDRSAKISVSKDGDAVGQISGFLDSDTVAFTSDILNASGVWYSLAADTDFYAMLFPAQAGTWPGPWHMLYAIANAPEPWGLRVTTASSDYMTRLAIWLQNYQQISNTGTNLNTVVSMRCDIPVRDAITEMKQLLIDLYNDESLLSLFKEVLDSEESAAYLQPAGRGLLFDALDALNIDGTIGIEREYDYQGNILKDSITLPFADNFFLSELTIDFEETVAYIFGNYRSGDEIYPFDLQFESLDEGLYTGSFAIDYPVPDNNFDVDEEDIAEGHFAAEFSLTVDPGEETYDQQQDLCQRTYRYSVIVRPDSSITSKMNTMTAALTFSMSSQSRKQAPTSVEAVLSLNDQETESGLSMTLKMKTAAKWQPDNLNSLDTKPMALDSLSGSVLSQVLAGWQTNALMWLTRVMPADGSQGK